MNTQTAEKTQGAVPGLETRIRLFAGAGEGQGLLAFAELTIGGAFVIKDIRVVRAKLDGEGKGEVFVSFPCKKGTGAGEGKYFPIAHPVTAEARQLAIGAVLAAYEEALGKTG